MDSEKQNQIPEDILINSSNYCKTWVKNITKVLITK